ncbi:ATP-binding protein [Paludisphaera borealis]|uniref:histidine kinase n=1 Tax=Paludisphaera borealis TaxID=1387353 RepID=A0A1U7CLV5_9BACT|nr:ATP-binding protein [Paludisphaera borealis]APW59920.1 Sensor protein ZraS [Paludisphaera borealis]
MEGSVSDERLYVSLSRFNLRVPLGVQVGGVAALFVAALLALWATGASVVARERRRSDARTLLVRAGDELAARGYEIVACAGEFPDYPEEPSRDELDRELSVRSASVLAKHQGVEGGYLVLRFKSFLGTTSNQRRPVSKGDEAPKEQPAQERGESSLPPLEAGLIDIQVDAAIRKQRVLFSVEELEGDPPVTVAIRTTPMIVGKRIVGASWVMTRLVDPLFVDRSLQGYRLATGLALAGIILAFALTASLALTVRRQAAERDRLQTELRRSERLAALGKLLAGVAHEVRNPLAGIRAITQLWRRGLGMGDEGFDHLTDEVDRLEDIVSRLLQFTRADAQDLAPGDLNSVAAEAARLAEDRARDHEVRVELEQTPDLPSVNMAAPALVQVLRNLTTNALQVMPRGGVLRVSTHLDPARGTVSASVADDGPGLSADVLSHLFEPFFTTKAEGTGLGLAIAREIALAHRGDLQAENRPNGGAVFTLVLPVAEVPAVGGALS